MCETNAQCKNTEPKNLWESIQLLIKETSDKHKTITKEDKTFEKMTEREQEMEKRDSKQNNEMKKMKLELEVSQKQGSTSMNSVGTKEGRITKINDLTGQTFDSVYYHQTYFFWHPG